MSTTLSNAIALKPDILVISGHSNGAATAARQIDEMIVNISFTPNQDMVVILDDIGIVR